MFWDRVAPLYDFFENTFNRGVYDGTGVAVAQLVGLEDEVLECACGTGAISTFLAPICKRLVATDFSEGMLKQARKKLAKYRKCYARPAFRTSPKGSPSVSLSALPRLVQERGLHAHRREAP